jgi:hypothetical protein
LYFIATAADTNASAIERTIDEFRGFTLCLNGAMGKGVIDGTGAWNIGDIKGKPAIKNAFEMGKGIE